MPRAQCNLSSANPGVSDMMTWSPALPLSAAHASGPVQQLLHQSRSEGHDVTWSPALPLSAAHASGPVQQFLRQPRSEGHDDIVSSFTPVCCACPGPSGTAPAPTQDRMKLACLLMALWVCRGLDVDASERCDDWGLDPMKQIQVYDGEPARIKCPLFQDFLKHNYSTAHSAGLTLMWYWTRRDNDLEEPINFRLPDNRITKEKETLWFKPAALNDTGNYTCMLRNTSYCSKVAFPLEVLQKDPGSCVSQSAKPELVELRSGHLEVMTCPDIDGFYPPNVTPTVTWYLTCRLVYNYNDRYPHGENLTFTDVITRYQGNYTCVLVFEDNGKKFTLTRTSSMKVIGSPRDERPPTILEPNDKVVYEIEAGDQAHLPCEVLFSFVKGSRTDVWWTINGKNAGDAMDPRINITSSVEEQSLGVKRITMELSIKDFSAEDLKRNYTCFAKNDKGLVSWQASVKLKVPPPRYVTELACGLGVTLFLVVALIIIYHIYWLEMVLFYRAHFGTDETVGDGKEYDVYVSYARNAEEEEFVLLTLRGVLEHEFGYKLCIFDRDSLPGGIVTDETLSFIKNSRRLLVVLSPNYVHQGTQALLELKAGLDNMASQGSIRVILVQYKAIKSRQMVKELKRAQKVLTVIKWKGEKSKYPAGRFWKQLHVALPAKKTLSRASFHKSKAYSEHYPMQLEPHYSSQKDSGKDLP
ncbi:interleukin-1 receptor accessory protein isoform X2 [Ambystoma mexicanum]|uniref:interleukin-1 receptor accessory protein isoform X2 n=1 Tax=Ambystoma mexicanum TaxID=8296 RepID=UPI0037E81A99